MLVCEGDVEDRDKWRGLGQGNLSQNSLKKGKNEGGEEEEKEEEDIMVMNIVIFKKS